MNEEVKIKISQPMFEAGELERFDNNIHNIIEEYSKLMFKEKDQILTQRIIMKQEEEIKRLKEEYMILQNASDEVEEKKDKEIERQKEIIRQLDIKNLELTSIIKEAREKIRNVNISYLGLRSGKTFITTLLIDILKILDKEK